MKLPMLFALVALAAWQVPARAEHASIDLNIYRLDAGTGQTMGEASAHADQEPPAGGVSPRPVFKAKVNDSLVLQFFLTNTYPHGDLKDVTVNYFVVRQEKAGQKQLPEMKNEVVKGSFTLNFKPKAKVGARMAFTVKEPGIYLLRVQTLNTNSDHEHFSAIDLEISR
jgi:hypothetical protein